MLQAAEQRNGADNEQATLPELNGKTLNRKQRRKLPPLRELYTALCSISKDGMTISEADRKRHGFHSTDIPAILQLMMTVSTSSDIVQATHHIRMAKNTDALIAMETAEISAEQREATTEAVRQKRLSPWA